MGVDCGRGPCHHDVVRAFKTAIATSPSVSAHTNGSVVAHGPGCRNSLKATVSRTVRLTVDAPGYGCALKSMLDRIALRRAIVNLRTRGRVRVTNRCPSVVVNYFNNNSGFKKVYFPFVHRAVLGKGRAQCVTTRPTSYPGLAHNGFRCSFNSRTKCAPLLPVFALKRGFSPTGVRTKNLHCRNTNIVISRLLGSGLVRTISVRRLRSFRTNYLFTRTRKVVPTPRSYRTVTTTMHRTGGYGRSNRRGIVLFGLSNRKLVSVTSCSRCLTNGLVGCRLGSRSVRGGLSRVGSVWSKRGVGRKCKGSVLSCGLQRTGQLCPSNWKFFC